jgi:serine-type D-Ala-D-Ala carboxypeptidase/endopeptidase (penicillin-binding protein 4)
MNETTERPADLRQASILGVSFLLALVLLTALAGFPGIGAKLPSADARGGTMLRRDRGADSALRPLGAARYADDEIAALERAVARALAPLGAKARVGLSVVDPRSGQVLVARGSQQALIPASNTKIFTGAAIYDRLGVDHTLETAFHARGEMRDGVLLGDLLVMGGGDPTVSGRFHDQKPMVAMAQVASALKKSGLREIRGGIVAGRSPFSGPRRGPNWPKDGYHQWWMVDVVALPFNDNQITLRCLPRGQEPVVQFEPALGFGRLRNRLKITTSKSRHRIVVSRKDRASEFTVSGQLWSRGAGYSGDFNVADGTLYYLHALRRALRDQGIALGGELRRADVLPASDDQLLYRRSTPVSRVVPVMLKRSQNLYAELLFRELGRRAGPAGSFDGSASAMRNWLKERKLLDASTQLRDGSGLSRSNRVSPAQTVRLLAYFDRRQEVASDFREALAVPGETGTLRKRMKDLRGRVFAKTGTLNRVSALSGYARAQDGGWLAFSILCNDCSVSVARKAQDAVCRALCAFGQAAPALAPEGAVGVGR